MPVAAARRPSRVLTRTLVLGTGALLAAALLSWTPTVVSGWNQGAAEATVWQLLNGARVNNGMAPLQQHGTLIGLARWRSQDMLNRNYFSHTIPGCGCPVYPYYDSAGVNYVWGGENIGWNSGRSDGDSPVVVHNDWMNSPGHRANILNAAFTHGGVGGAAANGQMYQGYVQNTRMYTQLFAQVPGGGGSAPRPGAPAPAPAAQGGSRGGGGSAPTAAAPAAAAQAPAKPKPANVDMDAPRRPTSAAMDGRAEAVDRDAQAGENAKAADDDPGMALVRFAGTFDPKITTAAKTGARADADAADAQFEVVAAELHDTGFFGGVITATFGSVFD